MQKKPHLSPDKGFEDYILQKKEKPLDNNLKKEENRIFRVNLKGSNHSRAKTYNNFNKIKLDNNVMYDSIMHKSIDIRTITESKAKDDHFTKLKNIELLTKIKGKFNDYLNFPDSEVSSSIIRYFVKGLKIISETDFDYKELISDYPKILNNILYLDNKFIGDYKDVLALISNERIQNYLKMNRIGKCSYNILCSSLLEDLKKKIKEFDENKLEMIHKIKHLYDELESKKDTIRILNDQLIRIREEINTNPQATKIRQLKIDISQLDHENQELKLNQEILINKFGNMESELAETKQKNDLLSLSVQNLEEKLELFANEKAEILKQTEIKQENFSNLKIQVQNLKNVLDKIILKVSSLKTYFIRSQLEKSTLLQERNDLVLRAAAGFENLTPRPNFSQMCTEKNLNFQSFFSKSEKKKKFSSVYICDLFLSKLCEIQAKGAFYEAELKRKNNNLPSSGSLRKVSNAIQNKTVFNSNRPTINANSGSGQKLSKMVSIESLEKKSKFVSLDSESQINNKISNDLEQIDFSPSNNMNISGNLLVLEKVNNDNFNDLIGNEDNSFENYAIQQADQIIAETIESKKLISSLL